MSDVKHTPGPWKVGGSTEWDAEFGGDADAYSTQPITADKFATVCIVVGVDDNDEEFEANARLIAAAPELLDALTDCLARFTEAFPAAAEYAPIQAGYAAIAKAEGRTP